MQHFRYFVTALFPAICFGAIYKDYCQTLIYKTQKSQEDYADSQSVETTTKWSLALSELLLIILDLILEIYISLLVLPTNFNLELEQYSLWLGGQLENTLKNKIITEWHVLGTKVPFMDQKKALMMHRRGDVKMKISNGIFPNGHGHRGIEYKL